MRKMIFTEITLTQTMFVRGVDREGHAILVSDSRRARPLSQSAKNPSRGNDTESLDASIPWDGANDEHSFILAIIYSMERAVASSEHSSKGKMEKISVVFDCTHFSSSHSPSMATLRALVPILQNRYTDRLRRLIVLNPKMWMRTIYAILKPFMDPFTRQKFVLVHGEEKKVQVLSECLGEDQAKQFMNTSEHESPIVDLNQFLIDTPFHLGILQA
jgi:CRAL/TRIO domain